MVLVGNEPDIFTDYQRNLTLWNKDAYYVQWTVSRPLEADSQDRYGLEI